MRRTLPPGPSLPAKGPAGILIGRSANTAPSSSDQIGLVPPNGLPEKAGKPRLSASFVMTANRNAASNRAAARRCSRRGPPWVWSGPDALPVLRCGLLSRSAAGHLQATLNRTEWGLPTLDRLAQRHPECSITGGQNSGADLALRRFGAHQPREDAINTLLHGLTPTSRLGCTHRCRDQGAKRGKNHGWGDGADRRAAGECHEASDGLGFRRAICGHGRKPLTASDDDGIRRAHRLSPSQFDRGLMLQVGRPLQLRLCNLSGSGVPASAPPGVEGRLARRCPGSVRPLRERLWPKRVAD